MKRSKLLAAVLSAVIVATATVGSMLPASAGSNADGERSLASYFQDPTAVAKPMARMWFPDTSAGADENDTIGKQIEELAEGGFGGVELTMLGDSSRLNNTDAKNYGWGTDSHRNLIKKAFRAAQKVEDGFVIDITISAHWPITVNNMDPNDDVASQEISSSVTKITADDVQNGQVKLLLPPTKTYDKGVDTKVTATGQAAYFIFTDDLVSSSIAKVIDVKEDGSLELEYVGMKNVTDATSPITLTEEEAAGLDPYSARTIDGVTYAGSAAGIPDEEYLESKGITEVTYDQICEWFGPEQANPEETAKIDADHNRKRLADWQYHYAVDLDKALGSESLDGLNNEENIEVGDYVVVSTFHRGTGQIMSGGASVPMYNRSYVPDYYTAAGVQTIIDYWNNEFLDDELRQMIQENGAKVGGSIFEDSLEVSFSSAAWSYDLDTKFDKYMSTIKGIDQQDYAYDDVASAIVAANNSQKGGYTSTFSFGTETDQDVSAEIEGISTDYTKLLDYLYSEEHCVLSNEFANSLGYTYRAQPGVGHEYATASLNIIEGDDGNKGDGLRKYMSALNITDGVIMSEEAVTGMAAYGFNWADTLTEVYSNIANGVNRVVLHGTPYSKGLNNFAAQWPGWDAFSTFGNFAEAYTYREIYWDDVQSFTSQIARMQNVLQAGQNKVDLAILGGATKGNNYKTLLYNGFSYNLVTETLLTDYENTKNVTNKQIYEAGPGYKALIVNGEYTTTLNLETVQQMENYAKAGLPIIFYNGTPAGVSGTEMGDNTSANVTSAIADLIANYDNVTTAESEQEMIYTLHTLGVDSHASISSHEAYGVEVELYQDTVYGDNYYVVYNSGDYVSSGMLSEQDSRKFKDNDLTDFDITLSGSGTPYIMDPVSGSIKEAGEYTVNGDGTVTVHIDSLPGGYLVFIALSDNACGDFPQAAAHVTGVNADKTDYEIVRNDDGSLSFRSDVAGTYQVSLSDGTVKEVVIDGSEDLDLTDNTYNLVLDSYGPKYQKDDYTFSYPTDSEKGIVDQDPSESKVTTVNFGPVSLNTAWKDLKMTDQAIQDAGFDSWQAVMDYLGVGEIRHLDKSEINKTDTIDIGHMSAVSGIGHFTTTFEWDGVSGAYLNLTYKYDTITGITINGVELKDINNISDIVDLGEYLVKGENIITIDCCSTLRNRAIYENNFTKFSVLDYMLTNVSLDAYQEVELTTVENPDPSNPDDSSDSSDSPDDSSSSNPSDDSSNPDVPNTGDSALPFAGIALLAALSGLVVYKARKK